MAVSLPVHSLGGPPRPPSAKPLRPGDNDRMALRLFRSTGYSTLLMPGESRMPTHPAMLVLWGSLWLALACNVGVWRWIAGSGDVRTALGSFLVIAGASGTLFSLLGWRRTLKPILTLALVAGALVAAGLWSQQLPMDTLWQGPSRVLLPAWASFMRWNVLALVALLAVVPVVWLWNHQVRRIPGPRQLQSNITGSLLAALMFGAGLFLIH
jgi:glucan phosphoethanolaminetransferase (alkaline phosphatase superfamily)